MNLKTSRSLINSNSYENFNHEEQKKKKRNQTTTKKRKAP